MTDATPGMVLRLNPKSADDIPLGLLRLSLEGRITYLNKAAREIAGPDVGVGSSIHELHLSDDGVASVLATLEDRKQQFDDGIHYTLRMDRQDLGTTVFIDVVGMPEYDAGGRVTGSVGIVTDKSMANANIAIHNAINGKNNWRDLLSAFDAELRRVIKFDGLMISLMSADRTALRIFYERPEPEGHAGAAPAWRWWPMPAFVKADLDALDVTRADDVQAMFSAEPYRSIALSDTPTQEWLKRGYKHMLRRPVVRQSNLLAIVALVRKQDEAFTEADIHRIEQLPVGEAVLMALALDHQSELEWGLGLIGKLGRVAGELHKVAEVLVEELRTNFGWEHVSLFRVDNDKGTVTIVHQSGEPESMLESEYTQSIDVGLLGYVARSGQAVRIADVNASALYKEGIAGTLSEMCLPVPGDTVRWIVNVESPKASAFALEEEHAVTRLLEVAGLILDRTLALQFNATVLNSVADAIIQTSSRGDIRNVNPACLKLLGHPAEAALVGRHLASLISAPGDHPDPSGFAARVVAEDMLMPAEVELLSSDGTPIRVLLSARSLPLQIGGKVYVASDLRPAIAVQRMEALQQGFRQLASESRVPLALVSAYLDELRELPGGADSEVVDLIEMARRQLRRADLPLERVVRMAAADEGQELPLQALSLADLADKLVKDLPRTQANDVVLPQSGQPTRLVLAARAELNFCASSMLAFMLRMKAQRDVVRLSVGSETVRPSLNFELIDPLTDGPSETRLHARSEHQRDFALAERLIAKLMDRMRGSMQLEQSQGFRMRLELTAMEAT